MWRGSINRAIYPTTAASGAAIPSPVTLCILESWRSGMPPTEVNKSPPISTAPARLAGAQKAENRGKRKRRVTEAYPLSMGVYFMACISWACTSRACISCVCLIGVCLSFTSLPCASDTGGEHPYVDTQDG